MIYYSSFDKRHKLVHPSCGALKKHNTVSLCSPSSRLKCGLQQRIAAPTGRERRVASDGQPRIATTGRERHVASDGQPRIALTGPGTCPSTQTGQVNNAYLTIAKSRLHL